MIKSSVKKDIIYSLLGVILVFLLWFLLYFIVANNYLIPSPLLVIKESFLNLLSGEFYSHFLSTILRVLLAILISFIIGVFLAIISSLYNNVEKILLPILSIIRSIPVFAILLIILVAISRVVAPVVVCVLTTLPIVYSNCLNYLNSINKKQKQMLKVYNVPLKNQIFSVYLKGYLPLLIKELSALFSFSLKLIVSAEILANVYLSIGGDIYNASIYSNITLMFSLTLIICLIGIIVEIIGNFICYKMEKNFKWR